MCLDASDLAVQVLQNSGTTLVPLKARYIQTRDGHAPTPGTANAYASFTVTYR